MDPLLCGTHGFMIGIGIAVAIAIEFQSRTFAICCLQEAIPSRRVDFAVTWKMVPFLLILKPIPRNIGRCY